MAWVALLKGGQKKTWSMTPNACCPIFSGCLDRGPRILFVVATSGASSEARLPSAQKKPSHTLLAPGKPRRLRHTVAASPSGRFGTELASRLRIVAASCALSRTHSKKVGLAPCSAAGASLTSADSTPVSWRMRAASSLSPLFKCVHMTCSSLPFVRARSVTRTAAESDLEPDVASGKKLMLSTASVRSRQNRAQPMSSASGFVRTASSRHFEGNVGANATPPSCKCARYCDKSPCVIPARCAGMYVFPACEQEYPAASRSALISAILSTSCSAMISGSHRAMVSFMRSHRRAQSTTAA
mmetsp:Transcript_475/g.986  ORF Transcript_475/g.986 Transcript_475/m.986 type:complete len:299 (+) Transcript_475:295-1191(+)